MNEQLFRTCMELAETVDKRPKVLKDLVRRPKSFRYYPLFVHLARIMNPSLIVELGTANGAGALHFKFGAPEGARVVTVDIKMIKLIRDRLDANCVERNTCDSTAYAEYEEDGTVDICFIDADHTYKAVKSDFAAWLPKMKPGGIILFDDVRMGDISDFWDELEGDKLEVKELHASYSFGVLFV